MSSKTSFVLGVDPKIVRLNAETVNRLATIACALNRQFTSPGKVIAILIDFWMENHRAPD